MDKAIIIGGSNGIGLAIAANLINKGYYVDILDRQKPESGILLQEMHSYHHINLLDLDEDLIATFASDPEIHILMITAGCGRVADFEYLHIAEIKNMMTISFKNFFI